MNLFLKMTLYEKLSLCIMKSSTNDSNVFQADFSYELTIINISTISIFWDYIRILGLLQILEIKNDILKITNPQHYRIKDTGQMRSGWQRKV